MNAKTITKDKINLDQTDSINIDNSNINKTNSNIVSTNNKTSSLKQTNNIKRNPKRSISRRVQILTLIALFSAMAYLLHFFQIKAFGFLTYEPKNTIITLSGIILGPWYAVIVNFFAAFLELITTSDTGWYGFLMNFISGLTFSLPIAFIYRAKRNTTSLILGLITGVASLLGFMCLLNLAITPLYLGGSSIEGYKNMLPMVLSLMPTAIVPFNTIKGVIDSIFIMTFIRPILSVVSNMPNMNGITKSTKKWQNVLYIICTLILLALAITLLILMALKVIG